MLVQLKNTLTVTWKKSAEAAQDPAVVAAAKAELLMLLKVVHLYGEKKAAYEQHSILHSERNAA